MTAFRNVFKIISVSIAAVMMITLGAAVFFGLAGYADIPLGNNRISSILKSGRIPEGWGKNGSSANEDAAFMTPDPHRLRVIFALQDDNISAIYVEALDNKNKTVSFFEIPGSAKTELSDELYKDLLVYAPTLPKYVKISRLPDYFSDSFRFEGIKRVISEATDEKIEEWTAVDSRLLTLWMQKGYSGEMQGSPVDFYGIFESVAENAQSGTDPGLNMMYYELYRDCIFTDAGVIPGNWDKTDYLISRTAAREALEGARY